MKIYKTPCFKYFLLLCLILFTSSSFLHAQETYESESDVSDRWGNQNSWEPNGVPGEQDTVVITNGTFIYLNQDRECAKLIVEPDGELSIDGNDFIVYEDIRVDGRIVDDVSILLDGDDHIIDGTGKIDGSVQSDGNKTIPDSAELTINGTFEYLGGHTITNNGRISIFGDLSGDNSDSEWINAAGSQLDIGGDLLKTNGTLEASADNNRVNYKAGSTIDIKDPMNSEYYHLEISGGTTGQLQNDITLGGDLNISNGIFNSNSNEIKIKGDFINKDEFNGEDSKVIFNGSEDQSIQSQSATEVFGELELLNGNFYLGTDIQAKELLELEAGIIDTETNKLILGESSSNTGTFNYIDGTIVGEFERYINKSDPSFPVSFPVGTYEHCRPVDIIDIGNDGISTGGSVSCKFIPENPGNDGLSLDDDGETVYNTFTEGYWKFQENGGFELYDDVSVDVRVKGEGFSTFTPDESTRLLYREDDTQDWQLKGDHDAAPGDTAKRINMPVLAGEYAFGDNTDCDPPGEPNITGNTNVCADAAEVSYEVDNISSDDEMCSWEVSGGEIDRVEGENNEKIYVNWGSEAQEGTVEAVLENDCASGPSASLPVKIHSMAPSSIDGPKEVAEGETDVTYSVDELDDYSYSWNVDGGSITEEGTSSITVDWGDDPGTGTIEVTGTYEGCNESDPLESEVEIYHVVESTKDGRWHQNKTWEEGVVPTSSTSVRIKHEVTLDQNRTAEHVVIASTGNLLDEGNDFTVTGNYTNKGEHSGTGDLILEGNDTYINGTGNISSTGKWKIEGGDKTIIAPADITKENGDFEISGSQTVTNDGIITIGGDLTSSEGTCINSEGATLNYGGPDIDGIEFRASGTDNIVNYNADGGQDIYLPDNGSYYHLNLTGTGDKTMKEYIEVVGDLTIESNLVTNNFNLTVKGDWYNTGTFDEGSAEVTFDGESDQNIDNSSGEEFHDLVVNKTGGRLFVNNDVTVSNQLTMTKGNIEVAQDMLLTLGTGTDETGTLNYNSGTIIGAFEKWINSSETGTEFLFPVGTSSYYRPLRTEFNSLTDGGSIICEFVPSDPGTSGIDGLEEGGLSVGDVFEEGYWKFENNSLSSTDFDIEVEPNGFDEYVITEDTRLLTRDDESSDWTLNGDHVESDPDNVGRDNVSKLPAEFGVAHMSSSLNPDIAPDDSIPEVCGEDTIVLDANISDDDYSYTWYEDGDEVGSDSQTYELIPDNPGDNIKDDGYIAVEFKVEVDDGSSSGEDTQEVHIYRRPETGNQYYVPNDFDQE